jgi:hypothetical protein
MATERNALLAWTTAEGGTTAVRTARLRLPE